MGVVSDNAASDNPEADARTDAAGVSLAPSAPPPTFAGGGDASSPSRPAQTEKLLTRGDLEMQSTLDEPVMDTIMRDLRSITDKLKFVLMPSQVQDRSRLKEWDLWGPLLLCLTLGMIIAVQAPSSEQASYAFADVFVIVWLGSSVVTLNALVLRGKVSFFLTVCVLGYCLSPLVIAAFLAMVFRVSWLKLVLVVVGFGWASKASVGFMEELVPEDKRLLGLYPVWLFYAAIAWMILVI